MIQGFQWTQERFRIEDTVSYSNLGQVPMLEEEHWHQMASNILEWMDSYNF